MITPELDPCPLCKSPAEFDRNDGSYGYYPPSVGITCTNRDCRLNLPKRAVRDRPQDKERPTYAAMLETLAAEWNR